MFEVSKVANISFSANLAHCVSPWRLKVGPVYSLYQFTPGMEWLKLGVWFVCGLTMKSLHARGCRSSPSWGERDWQLKEEEEEEQQEVGKDEGEVGRRGMERVHQARLGH